MGAGCRSLVLVLALLAAGGAPTLASELFDACAASAASYFEPGYEGVGPAGTDFFYAYDAIPACEAAHAENPDSIEVMAWLGNAYALDNEAVKAAPLLERAAAAGNLVALRALGDLYILGKGVPRDQAHGLALLNQAGEAGFAPAGLSLGYCYEFGDGVAVDMPAALRWYTLAAEAGMTRAQLIVARLYREGAAGIVPDEAVALHWLQRAAALDDSEALYLVGVAYLEGRGTPVSLADARDAFAAASAGYFARGTNALGYMTELGLGLEADPDAARSLYLDGAQSDLPVAKHNLARLEEQRRDVASAERDARRYYEDAAQAGELRAAVNLGLMLLEGRGGAQDIAGALRWTQRAADGGNPAGLNNLGRFHELGLGTTPDLATARRLYGEAAERGYAPAMDNLARLGG